MLTTRRIRSADGLTVTEKIDLSRATKDEWLALGDGPGGFEWRIRDIEQFWQTHVPPEGSRIKYQSLPWSALDLGWQLGVAFLRFNLGAEAQTGIKRRGINRKAGIQSGIHRKNQSAPSTTKIEQLARSIRRSEPYSRSDSPTTLLARTIGKRLSLKTETVRKKLGERGIK